MSEAETVQAARVLVARWEAVLACEREYWRLLGLSAPTEAEQQATKDAAAARQVADVALEAALVALTRAVEAMK